MYPDTFEGFAVHAADQWKTPKRHEVRRSSFGKLFARDDPC